MNPLTFVCLVGVPASGKSTYAKTLLAVNPNMVYLCPDIWREEMTGDMSNHSCDAFIWNNLLYTRIIGAQVQRKDIVFDSTAYRPKNRKGPCAFAKEQGYRVVAHVMMTPFSVCWERNMARERIVPRPVFDRMVAGWTLPDLTKESYIDEIVEVSFET